MIVLGMCTCREHYEVLQSDHDQVGSGHFVGKVGLLDGCIRQGSPERQPIGYHRSHKRRLATGTGSCDCGGREAP